jgi:hypothetical protein
MIIKYVTITPRDGWFRCGCPVPGRLGSVSPGIFVWGREGKWSEGERRNKCSFGFTIFHTGLLTLL